MSYVLHRLFQGFISLFILFTAVFFLIRLVPGDPATLLAGPAAPAETVERIRQQFGFDRPFIEQYATYLGHAVQGDFGRSTRTQKDVVQEVLTRLPNTASLALVGMAVAATIGIAAGIVAALFRNRGTDIFLTSVAVLAISVPSFWLALLLVNTFSISLGWLPAYGANSWRHYILPSLVVAAAQIGLIMRVTRGAVIDTLGAEYIKTAQAKGASRARILIRHALRNAVVPIVTVVFLQIGVLFNGAVVTESIFNWPGVGRYMIESVLARDYPSIQVLVLAFGTIFVCINLLSDIVNALADPRLRRTR